MERNWKERVCGLSDHQPDNAGVLCAVDICQQCVLAWYVTCSTAAMAKVESYAFFSTCAPPATPLELFTRGTFVMNLGL